MRDDTHGDETGAPPFPGEPLIDAEAATQPPPVATPASAGSPRILLGVSLVLISLNLRAVFSSVSALLPEILRSTGLQPATASLLTTLPVLCLGLFAPLAPGLAQRFGAERTVAWLLALLTLGTAVRGLGTVPSLLLGAVLSGAAIAVVNVLLPGLIKRDFPDRVALMTGLFTMALSGGAAAAAGLTIPLERLFAGAWPLALAAWAVPAATALLLWLALTARTSTVAPVTIRAAPALWRSGLAWQVTLFMGLQSAIAYCVFGYLAPILRERGLSAAEAGAVVSLSIAVQCAACLTAPGLAVRGRDQRFINGVFFAIAGGGFVACVFAPLGAIWLWAALQGFGQGGLIALAMTAIVLRSPDAVTAARLSGMAQGVGYTLAAGGPLVMGVLRGATGSYAAGATMVIAIALAGGCFAVGAGRAVRIGDAATNPPT